MCCMLDGVVTQLRPVADRLSIRAFQVASSDHPCDNYRTVSSVCSVDKGNTCFHAQYRLIAGRRDNRKVTNSTIDIAISRNRYEPYT